MAVFGPKVLFYLRLSMTFFLSLQKNDKHLLPLSISISLKLDFWKAEVSIELEGVDFGAQLLYVLTFFLSMEMLTMLHSALPHWFVKAMWVDDYRDVLDNSNIFILFRGF